MVRHGEGRTRAVLIRPRQGDVISFTDQLKSQALKKPSTRDPEARRLETWPSAGKDRFRQKDFLHRIILIQ